MTADTPQPQVYQLKVALHPARPPIWRRLLVPVEATLADLHRAIQAVMAWEGYHLHAFNVGDEAYGMPGQGDGWPGEETQRDERKVRLVDLALQPRQKFWYTYDFGDDWEHEILVEAMLPADPAIAYPVCTGGRRAAPPEDVGGLWGFYEWVDVLATSEPGTGSYDEAVEVLGKGFDPAHFDLERVEGRLRQAFARRKVRRLRSS